MDDRVKRCNHLIKKIQKGNEKALDELFVEFGALFLNMAKKYLFDASYAEDLVSDVFVELVRTSAKSFDDSKNGLNWFFTIIRNKAYKYNGELKQIPLQQEDKDGRDITFFFVSFDPTHDASLDKIVLKNALKKLSKTENEIIYYKFWESLTIREIAKKIGKPRSTVQYLLTKSLRIIKEELDKQ